MQNIFDYLKWRGDLSFAHDPFNEVDNLILSNLAYLDYDSIAAAKTESGSMTLEQAAKIFKTKKRLSPAFLDNPFYSFIPNLIHKAAETTRFRNIRLSDFVNQIDHDNSIQFSAVIFSFETDLHYIAFRGTDDTFAGWIEDFRMSFMDEVAAQTQAVSYVNDMIPKLDGSFYLGGHSKGGNLAVYSSARTSRENQERILGIYNNDGPGFQKTIIQNEGYRNIIDRIHTYVPQSSVVGLLLERGEECKIVSSSKSGILQHNSVFWEVSGTHFVYAKELTKGSRNFNSVLQSWLEHLSMEQREQFVDSLFEILLATGARSFGELTKEKIKSIDTMVKTIIGMNPETKTFLKKTIFVLIKERQKIMRASLGADIDSLLTRKLKRK